MSAVQQAVDDAVRPPKRPLASIAQEAARTGINERYFRYLLELKRLPHYTTGRRIYLDPDEVDAYIRSCRVEALS